MAGMKFEYDENGGKFYYFILSFYALILVPCTYYLWPRKEKKSEQPHPEETSNFEPCKEKYQILYSNEPYKRRIKTFIKLIFIIAWVVFFVLAYQVSKIETEYKEYDPFAVLGLDRGASDKEIRKQYREMSKTMHPDKGGDPEKFKELTKALKSLTDNETKKNWEEYGNPDGPGVMHFGIALPKWMVDDKNSMFVLGIYVLIFMIIMPTVVGIWWRNSIKYTGDKVFLETTKFYTGFIARHPDINVKTALLILSASSEFDKFHNPDIVLRPSDEMEILQLVKDLPNLKGKTREKPYIVKTRALIYAHLSRLTLSRDTLWKDKLVIIKKCPFLINEMVNTITELVRLAPMWNIPPPRLETLENVMKLSPMIIQAVWDNKSSLLQLPNVDESHLRHFVTKKRNLGSIKQFIAAKDEERKSILRYLTDEQYDDIMRVCETYPHIEMGIKSEVYDDEDQHTITAGAIVTLTITLERQSLKEMVEKSGLDNKLSEEKAQVDENNEEKANDETVKAKANKPWEKQKKKPKYAKAKPKPKQKVVQKTAAKIAPNTQQAKVEDLVQETEKADVSDEEDDESTTNNNAKSNENESEDDNKKYSEEENDVSEEDEKQNQNTSQSQKDVNKSSNNSGEEDDFFEKFQQQQKRREKLETKEKISHRVFCPYYPEVKQECWWLYIADRKQRVILCPPVYICTLKHKEDFELKFAAPKKVGIYTCTVILRSDSYVDFDVFQNIKLDVKEAKTIEDHPQWDFSEDEEGKENPKDNDDDEYATEDDDD